MGNRLLLTLLYCFFLLYRTEALAQQVGETVSVESVLSELRQQHGVQFNYASSLLEGLTVSPIATDQSLQSALDYLGEQSGLDFIFLSKKIISIKKRKRLLCGYLKDKDTGEPLPYVTVQNGQVGTIADEHGFFEISSEERTDIIEIRHIGHKPLRREAKFFRADDCSVLYLVPDELQLAEVVLYDYLIRGIDKLDDGSFQIDFRKFSILPGLIEEDVLQAVQALPGIQSVDETVSNINIRGGSNDQNLITWDGIKMYQTGHFFGLISMYNPHITQKVSLRKNGSSAAETDGVSGTIAMETDAHLSSKFKGGIGINLLDANGFIDTPLGTKASVQVAARSSISGFAQTPTYSEYFDRIAQETEIDRNSGAVTNSDINFDFYDASFRLLYHPSEKDRLRLNFIHTSNTLTFNENATIAGAQEIRESNLDQQSTAGGIRYQRNWTERFRTELDAYETSYTLRATNANVLENQRFFQKNQVSETGVRLKGVQQITSQFRWMNGYSFIETKVTNLDDVDEPRFLLLEGEVLRTHGLFTEMGLASRSSDTQLNLGLRFNYLEKFQKQFWEPRLSLSHRFSKKWSAEVLGEFKHQSTSQIINFQNDFLGIEKRRWQLSNDNSMRSSDDDPIPVITSRQASLGWSYHDAGWLANTVFYYKKVAGITTQSQGFQDNYEFARTAGSYDAMGMDLLVRKQFKNMDAWFSYSYLDSDYQFNELSETVFPNNFDITHALTFGTNYELKRFLFAAGFNWRT